jgi:hypothetical protein
MTWEFADCKSQISGGRRSSNLRFAFFNYHDSDLANSMPRRTWTTLTDDQLLAQCEIDTYRASGPGGQKRNKTSSAVRVRHLPSGLIVIAEESRSQHENRARGLRRLRQALFLKVRDALIPDDLTIEKLQQLEDYRAARDGDGRLHMTRKDPRFWPAVGVVLDVLHAFEGRVSEAASALGVTTGNLISFLETDPKVWGEVNILRTRCGQKPLRVST